MKFLLYAVIIIIVLAVTFSLLTDQRERTEYKMGTFVSISLFGFRWHDFDPVFDKAFSAIDHIDNIANIYNEESEVSILNRTAYKSPVVVSNDLFLLIKDSKALYDASDGAFDVTVAPLVELWRPYWDRDAVPEKEIIQKTLDYVGSDKIVLNQPNQTVSFTKEGMKIDLSAIAKGYAVDKAIVAIKGSGFRSALVNAGGDLFCLGKKDLLFLWRVGIRDPRKKGDMLEILRLSNSAVATSGGYEQYFVYKNKDYTHLLHPKTGYPVESVFSSTTVVAKRCLVADAIATAVAVGGTDIISKLEDIYQDIDIITHDLN